MKTAAIIAEYNPFHNGHRYQMEEVRRLSGADFIVVVMSGDFVQRGEPAVFDKYLRTEAAIRCGADLVLELPVAFATGSAARFAEGAVSLIDALGFVDELWFGSECGEIELFDQAAQIFLDEPEEYRLTLQQYLKDGFSFPAARSAALCSFYIKGQTRKSNDYSIRDILSSPNNILGLEYVLALKRFGSRIIPGTIQRKESDYNDTELSGRFSSASAIRRLLIRKGGGTELNCDGEIAELNRDGELSELIRSCVPEEAFALYQSAWQNRAMAAADDFSLQLLYQLLKETPESLCGYLDLSEDLANRIINCRDRFESFSSFAELLKTKNQTLAAIRRALLHILLDIRQKDVSGCPSLVRMLGMSSAARKASLPGMAGKQGKIIITANPGTHPQGHLYEKDLFASSLYQSVRCYNSGGRLPVRAEYRRKLIVL